MVVACQSPREGDKGTMGLLGKLFKKSIFAYVRVNARLEPITRGDILEDPLDEILKAHGLGEVSGGGTEVGDGEILWCGIDLELKRADDDTISKVVKILTKLGVPKGSVLEFGDTKIPVGTWECAKITCESGEKADELVGRAQEGLTPEEHPHQYGEYAGKGGDTIYLYGPSYAAIHELFSRAASAEPSIRCQIALEE